MRNLSTIFNFARLAAFAAILLAFGHGAALADAERAWTLQETSGQVRLVKSGISPVALTVGDTFSGGDWIETGPDGRAVVRRGDESIVVAPNSRIGLPRDNTGSFATRILQTLGTILLTVEKKTSQHFEVRTPYLTAVVKGTTFAVGIQGQRAVVHVIEGLVEVRDLASGQRGMVRPGQTGVVLSGSGSGVTIDGAPAGAGRDSAAASAPVQASDQRAAAAREAGSTGQAVAAAAREAGAKGHAVAASKIAIRVALGPQTIDLKSTTGGLMRAANGAQQGTALGKNSGGKSGVSSSATASPDSTRITAADADSISHFARIASGSGLGIGVPNGQGNALRKRAANVLDSGVVNTLVPRVGSVDSIGTVTTRIKNDLK